MEHKQGAFVLLKIHWLCILFIYGQSSVNCGKGTKDSLTDTSHHPQDNQSDQMQRAVVLVHRRVPRDVNDRLQKLEIRVGEMARVLDMVRAQTDKLLRLENRMDELARKLNMATRNDSLQHLEDISRELDCMQKTINTQTDNLSRLENRMDELARTLNVAIRNDSLQHLEDISRQLDRMQKTFIAQTHKLWRLENRMDELARTLNVAIKNDSLQHLEHISRELDRMQKTVKAQTEKLSLLENRINVTTRNDRLQNLEDISRKLDHRLHLVNVENEKLKREMYFLKSCLKEQCKEDTCDKDNRECPSRPCPTQNFAENALGCPTHTCDTGKRECPPQDCKEENLPGNCNEQTRSCTQSGVSYNHGDSWRSVESPCDICHCLDGYVRCEREQCYTPCRNPAAPPPNTCCPVCEGCDVNGHEVPNGAVIPVGDPCQECRCKNGNMVCSYVRCPAPSCHNPVHHAGECCPRCEQCEYESKVYGNGERFTSKRDPCLQCYCSAGEVFCINMSGSCPTPHCTHSARHRGECCATCNDCEYEQRVYADGEMFRIPESGPCLHCRCKGGNITCHEKKCPPVHCSNPINHPHLCCPSC